MKVLTIKMTTICFRKTKQLAILDTKKNQPGYQISLKNFIKFK